MGGIKSGLILLNNSDIYVAGETGSTNFPYMSVRTGKTDAFICRFNENDAPEPLPFTGRSGHWQSNENGTEIDSYLDVNICDDGSFSGILKLYLCFGPDWPCILSDNSPTSQVSGGIDFQNWIGTITMDNENKDVPFRITKQEPDEFIIEIDSDASTTDWPYGRRFFLYYQGKCEAGTCQDTPPGGSGDNGGSGGGCFLNSMADSLELSNN